MKIKLSENDFKAIAANVKNSLLEIMPQDPHIDNSSFIVGPEFLAEPLRVATGKTEVDFTKEELGFIKNLRKEIDKNEKDPKERKAKKQHLDSIILFGQLLFSQSASSHFLDKMYGVKEKEGLDQKLEPIIPEIDIQLKRLKYLLKFEEIKNDTYSKRDTLVRRKEFTDVYNQIMQIIKDLPEPDKEKKQALLEYLHSAKHFYYQANELNFKYANKPSRDFSTFVNNCEKYGGRLGLSVSGLAIIATALAFFPPLTPIMAPIAFVASMVSLSIAIPLALKNISTMLHNLIQYGAKPTPIEVANVALFGVGIALAGAGPLISSVAHLGKVASETTTMAIKGASFANKVGNTGFGVGMQVVNTDKVATKAQFSKTKKEYQEQIESRKKSDSEEKDLDSRHEP